MSRSPRAPAPSSILRGLSMDARCLASRSAVVGPKRAGKSTLLMVIAGLERATSGHVAVLGADYAKLGEDGLARLRAANIGIVFQSFHLVPTMTALENVALPLEFLDRDDAFEAARAALAEVGLSHREDHFPGQLSGGEQQRVAMARALGTEAFDHSRRRADRQSRRHDRRRGHGPSLRAEGAHRRDPPPHHP